MRTLIDIDDRLMNEVLEVSKVKTKKCAITVAMKEYLNLKKREYLKKMIGNYNFGLTLKDLEKLRNE